MDQLAQKVAATPTMFAIRTFIAIVWAISIGFWLDFSSVTSMILTVYFVSQQYAGQVLSRAYFRTGGTLVGSAVVILFTDLYYNSPLFFTIFVATWVAGCSTLNSHLSDKPPAYGAALSGYTVTIVGTNMVTAPQNAFNIASERVLEITIGVICATILHTVLVPNGTPNATREAIEELRKTLAKFVKTVLQNNQAQQDVCGYTSQSEEERERAASGGVKKPLAPLTHAEKAKLAEKNSQEFIHDAQGVVNAVKSVSSLRSYSVIETEAFKIFKPSIQAIEMKSWSMASELYQVSDLLSDLWVFDQKSAEELQPMLDALAKFVNDSQKLGTVEETKQYMEKGTALRERLIAYAKGDEGGEDLVGNLQRVACVERMVNFLDDWCSSSVLEAYVQAGEADPNFVYEPYKPIDTLMDWRFAAITGGMVFTCICTAMYFGVETAWTSGAGMVVTVSTQCTINPMNRTALAGFRQMLGGYTFGLFVALVYSQVILVRLDSFWQLVIAVFPFLFWIALLIGAGGKHKFFAMMLVPSAVPMLGLANSMNYDLASTWNSFFANFGAIVTILIVGYLYLPIASSMAIHLIRGSLLKRIGALPQSCNKHDLWAFRNFTYRMMNSVLPQVDLSNKEERDGVQTSFANFTIGEAIIRIQSLRDKTPAAVLNVTDKALGVVQSEYKHARPGVAPKLEQLRSVESAIKALSAMPRDETTKRVMVELFNIAGATRKAIRIFSDPSDKAILSMRQVMAS